MDKRFIITSVVKEELKARSGLATISSEAIDWVNDQVGPILDRCATAGRRTPGGRLMAPPEAAAQLVRAIAEDSRLPQLRIERIDGHGIDTEPVAAITAALAEAGCYRSPRSLRLRAGDR